MLAAIPGWPGYLVSDDGRVFSTQIRKKMVGQRGGTFIEITDIPQLELRLLIRFGYAIATLRDSATGRSRQLRVHRLVLMAFVGLPPNDKPETRHLDGAKLNNKIENLAWASHQENINDKYSHGTILRGEHHWKAKLTESAIRKIRECPKRRCNFKALLEKYGISRRHLMDIRHRRTWKHVA